MTVEQTQQVIDTVQTGLNKASEALGVTVPRLWEVLIKQQYVEGVQLIIGTLISICIVVVSILAYKEGSKPKHWEERNSYALLFNTTGAMICTISFFVGFISLIFAVDFMGSAIGRFINPEYYAIQDLVSFFKDLTNE